MYSGTVTCWVVSFSPRSPFLNPRVAEAVARLPRRCETLKLPTPEKCCRRSPWKGEFVSNVFFSAFLPVSGSQADPIWADNCHLVLSGASVDVSAVCRYPVELEGMSAEFSKVTVKVAVPLSRRFKMAPVTL